MTVFLSLQWQHMRLSNSEANLLPDDHPLNIQYNNFLKIFGEEGNAIILGIRDSALLYPENFNRWNMFSRQLDAFPEIATVVSTENLKKLVKSQDQRSFQLQPLI